MNKLGVFNKDTIIDVLPDPAGPKNNVKLDLFINFVILNVNYSLENFKNYVCHQLYQAHFVEFLEINV